MGGGSRETEAHREGLPMVVRPGRSSTVAVVGLGGRRQRRRGRRDPGAGVEPVVVKPGVNGGRRWQTAWRRFPDGEGDDGLTDGGSRSSSRWPSGAWPWNGGSSIEGVLEWWRRCWHGGGGGGEGVPVVATCARNENLPSDSGRKACPKFIVSSINSGSTWNRC
jgi:hypothetical protein